MPTVTCDGTGNLDDGYMVKLGSDASAVRNATTSTSLGNTATIHMLNHGKVFGNIYVNRMLINFDLSGNDDSGSSLNGNTVDSATMIVVSYANLSGFSSIQAQTSNSIYIVKVDAGSSFDTGDWDSIDGWVSSGSYDGEATVYGTATEAANSTLTFTLSSECVGDINSAISAGEDFSVMVMTQDDFLSNIGSGGIGTPNTTSGVFANFDGLRVYTVEGDSSKAFKLNLTYGVSTPTLNSTFFGSNF